MVILPIIVRVIPIFIRFAFPLTVSEISTFLIFHFFKLKNKKKWKFFKFWSSYQCIWSKIFVRFALALTVSKISTFLIFLFIFLNLKKKIQNLIHLTHYMRVIPNFLPFHSYSYGFQDKHFFNLSFVFNLKKLNFINFGDLTCYNACDPKFSSVSLYLLWFPR